MMFFLLLFSLQLLHLHLHRLLVVVVAFTFTPLVHLHHRHDDLLILFAALFPLRVELDYERGKMQFGEDEEGKSNGEIIVPSQHNS